MQVLKVSSQRERTIQILGLRSVICLYGVLNANPSPTTTVAEIQTKIPDLQPGVKLPGLSFDIFITYILVYTCSSSHIGNATVHASHS